MTNRQYGITGLVLLLTLALGALTLTGCGKKASENDMQVAASGASIQADARSNEASPTETTPAQNADTESKHSNVLVVYFSATGHTKPLAKYAAEYLDSDIYEIVPKNVYTADDLNYNDPTTRATKEQNDAAVRPAITGPLPDISKYDVVVIGHPIWWGQAPKIIYTFLESYDWSGKTLVTFCTSGSSDLGSSVENLKQSASGDPKWLESRRFAIGTEKAEVTDWLQQILSK